MVYIDETLCTGCGLCADACKQQAITLKGSLAVVDATTCTGCNRCAAVCTTGAIRTVDVVTLDASPIASAHSRPAPADWPEATEPLATLLATPTATGSPSSARDSLSTIGGPKAALAQKVLSALAGLVGLAWERRQQSFQRIATPDRRRVGGSGRRRQGPGMGHGRGGGLGQRRGLGRRKGRGGVGCPSGKGRAG